MNAVRQRPSKNGQPGAERDLTVGERLHGLFADVDPGSSWADELMAERRAEARAEDLEDEVHARRRARQHAGR
jgi:hypothetical protein